MEAGQFPPGQFSSVSGSSSQKDIPTPFSAKNQTIEINGKFFRVKEMMVDGKKVDVSKLKSTDIQQLQSLARQAIQEEHGDTSSYTVSLTDNSAVVNGKEFIPEGQKTLNDVTTLGENLLKTQKQEKKHTFKSRVPSNAKATAIKVGAVALFILTSPLIIAIGLLIGGGVLLKDLGSSIKHAIFETDNLKEAMKEMKTKEEENKFNGLSKVHEKFLKPNDDAILNPIKIEVPHFHQNEKFLQETLQNKAERHINRALMRNSSDIDQTTISNLVKNLEVGDFASENALKTKLFSHMLGLEKVLEDNDIKLLVKEAKIASVNTREQDQKALQELQDALSSIPSDYRAANTRVTNALRAVIESPSYQAIKEDPNNLYVRYVSNISYGLWNSVQVIDEYKEFGKKVLGHVDQAAIQAEGLTAGEQQRKIMEEAHNQTKQQIYTDHGLAEKILYAFTHPAQALGSLNSEGGWHREIASAFGTSTYDPHGKFNNNPSLQGTTSATFANNQKASINNCYGGSPTIGDRYQTTISPEFEAVCQAVENQRFTKQKDPNIPDRIYYTNLQNIENHHGEGERSFAIMQLNDKYPLTFTGMTLAKDSKFHLMPDEKDQKWPGTQEYGSKMLEIFENEKCYQYGNRTKTQDKQGEYKGGNGIYLPGGKEAWLGKDGQNGPIHEIIGRANKRFQVIENKLKDENKELDSFKLKGAYQEYVYSMIQSYVEMQLAKQSDGKVMAIRACKENIDRGGSENAKYAHARLDPTLDQDTRNEIVVGAIESRALLARGRVILEKRMPHVLSFIELVEPKEIQEDTIALLDSLGIKFNADGQPKYQPATSA